MNNELYNHEIHPMNLGQARPTKDSAVIGYYLGQAITEPEEALRLRVEPEYLPAYARDSRTTKKYKCPYCGVWSESIIGLCEYCGAPKE